MEDKVKEILNNLNLDETEKLLKEDMEFKIDNKAMRRIKRNVYLKADFKNKRKFSLKKALIAALILVFVAITSFEIIGFDNVVAYINKVFNFVPGVGILENDDKIQYVITKTDLSENEDVFFKLNNAVATNNSITVMFSIEHKNYLDFEGKKFFSKPYEEPNVILYVNNSEYIKYSGSTGGGSKEDISTFTYTVDPNDINLSNSYKLYYESYNLSVEFKFKKVQSFEKLEDIGSTGYNNNISITAVPTFNQNDLEVNLYSIVRGKYHIDSYCKFNNKGYKGKDMIIETESGIKNYAIPDSIWDGYGKFNFNVETTDKNFTLKIPYLIVNDTEEKIVNIEIPKDGEKLTINKRVDFEDSSMVIVDVEKLASDNGSDDGYLKMNIKYENKYDNIIMKGASFNRVNYFGKFLGGGYYSEADDNDILTTVGYYLENKDKGVLRLKVSNPSFYLTDEYVLKFNR